MNISFRSKNPQERILSNLAHTPFTFTINGHEFRCNSVEGFWQGLKCKGEMRLHVFLLSGMGAKRAGSGKRGQSFEFAGANYKVGSKEHENLIRQAIKQKVLQNPDVAEALRESSGRLTHNVSGRGKPIFKMEKMCESIRSELYGR